MSLQTDVFVLEYPYLLTGYLLLGHPVQHTQAAGIGVPALAARFQRVLVGLWGRRRRAEKKLKTPVRRNARQKVGRNAGIFLLTGYAALEYTGMSLLTHYVVLECPS